MFALAALVVTAFPKAGTFRHIVWVDVGKPHTSDERVKEWGICR